VLSPRGGSKSGGDLFQMITRLDKSGCARYVLTDVNRDGALSGPNLELLKEVTSFTKTPIVASGGVSSLSDVKALMQLTDQGVEAVIIGKGLYTGTFTLAQVLSTVKGE
jgi:phosphoribosylformimino-5-aminoimidazole carboxamide ribonucleotide (ProFAR) isomerase